MTQVTVPQAVLSYLGSAILALFCTLCFTAKVSAQAEIDIPYDKFVLDNGLTVVVHEDRKAPIIAVNVWYHVGSKDEKPGKTGFAHLFEHLMFNGTENYNDEYFKPLEKVGATNMNGTTNSDRTNYFQTVPTTALDMTLWLESDRMGHLLGAINQDKLDEQRGVVKNEKRMGENRPYGQWFNIVTKETYPEGHPYSWTTIGSMEDLNAASVEDVHQWFKEYYGAANATLVLAGDIDVATAKKKVQKYFGHIQAGPPVIRPKAWVAKRQGEKRHVAYGQVPQSRLYMVWNVPQDGTDDAFLLDLAASILGDGKNSRLFKRLVYQDQMATNISVYNYTRELSGWFAIQADINPNVDPAKVEQVINEELALFLKRGPSKKEVQIVQTSIRAGFIRGVEQVGGYSGKSDILARNQVFFNDPGFYKTALQKWQSATPAAVQVAAQQWLSDGKFVLEYHPYIKHQTSEPAVDRSQGVPEVTQLPELTFPKLERATLSNGLKVIIAERHTIPVVEFEMQFDAGYAADQGGKLGASSFALTMLKEGTEKLSSLELSQRSRELGAAIGTGSSLDTSTVTLSALKENLQDSLALYADVILNPAFSNEEIERIRARWIAGIQQEQSQPLQQAYRILPPLLYGEGHAYAIPFTGSGTVESISSLQKQDLVTFHDRWLRPNNATLIVVGDTTAKEIVPELERQFGRWQVATQGKLEKTISKVSLPKNNKVYLVNKPEAVQSMIIAGHLVEPSGSDNDIPIDVMNTIIGGSFTSRINMNLREDKGWAYYARSYMPGALGQRPFMIVAPVQTDQTKASIQEVLRELDLYLGSKPADADELAKVIANKTRSLPGKFETADAVLSALSDITRYNRPDNYVETYKGQVENLQLTDIHRIATNTLRPASLTWVIIGDLSKIESDIRSLQLGTVQVLDAQGNALR